MYDKANNYVYEYMKSLSPDIKKEIGWHDKEFCELTFEEVYENSLAVLKIYGYLRYKDELRKTSFERICKVVEKEFEERDISLGDDETNKLRQIVKETLADLISTDIQLNEDVFCSKFLVHVRLCVCRLKQVPKYGEVYYKVINASFLENTYNLNTEELMQKIGISRSHYYRLRNQAITELSNVLWGDI